MLRSSAVLTLPCKILRGVLRHRPEPQVTHCTTPPAPCHCVTSYQPCPGVRVPSRRGRGTASAAAGPDGRARGPHDHHVPHAGLSGRPSDAVPADGGRYGPHQLGPAAAHLGRGRRPHVRPVRARLRGSVRRRAGAAGAAATAAAARRVRRRHHRWVLRAVRCRRERHW